MNPFDLTETAVLCTYAQHYIRTIQLLMDDVIVASSDDIDGIERVHATGIIRGGKCTDVSQADTLTKKEGFVCIFCLAMRVRKQMCPPVCALVEPTAPGSWHFTSNPPSSMK